MQDGDRLQANRPPMTTVPVRSFTTTRALGKDFHFDRLDLVQKGRDVFVQLGGDFNPAAIDGFRALGAQRAVDGRGHALAV